LTAVSLQSAGISNLDFASNLKVFSESELSALQSGERHRLQALTLITGSKESEAIVIELFRSISVLSHEDCLALKVAWVTRSVNMACRGSSREELNAEGLWDISGARCFTLTNLRVETELFVSYNVH
jgi:hypothetical protein